MPVPDMPVISTVAIARNLDQRLHQAFPGSQQAVPIADRCADTSLSRPRRASYPGRRSAAGTPSAPPSAGGRRAHDASTTVHGATAP